MSMKWFYMEDIGGTRPLGGAAGLRVRISPTTMRAAETQFLC